jgi:pyruvate/2-oxoglutarate/acetoin dehydrogenase E1 component
MPSYLETINRLLVREAARYPELVQFGENIAQGSRICGVARNLGGRLVTVGNCENTHVGAGLGMMLAGGQALLIVKQLDFLLLALDQMVNTMNLVRAGRQESGLGSFTILTIVCDQGWQGPQSSFNDLAGVCSLARVDGYYLNGSRDAERILSRHLVKPGFRIIAVSQGRFGEECLELPVLEKGSGGDCDGQLQYAEGQDATIAAFGFALPAALERSATFRVHGKRAAVFALNPELPYDWSGVVASAARSQRLIALDDGKGALSLAHKLVSVVMRAVPDCYATVETREHTCQWAVNEDRFVVAA